jgi:hypothetical protein
LSSDGTREVCFEWVEAG